MYWVFPSEAAANQAEQLILILGARVMALKAGWPRDEALRPLGKRASDGSVVSDAVTTRYAVPQECAEGWAIPSPIGHKIWTGQQAQDPTEVTSYQSMAGLAQVLGLDPVTVDWATLYPDVLATPYAAGLESVEMDTPVMDFMRAALWMLGLGYSEVETPTFPEPEEVI